MITRTVAALFLSLSFLSLSAQGATVTTNGDGDVTGINGLEVGDNKYNIRFMSFGESYQAVYAGALDINSEQEAADIIVAASSVLDDAAVLNIDIAGNPVASIDEDTNLILPYLSTTNRVAILELDWREPTDWRNLPVGPVIINVTDSLPDTAWIRVSPVPLPAAGWLFGCALFGLLTRARRRNL